VHCKKKQIASCNLIKYSFDPAYNVNQRVDLGAVISVCNWTVYIIASQADFFRVFITADYVTLNP
jgi:hypothetical protein